MAFYNLGPIRHALWRDSAGRIYATHVPFAMSIPDAIARIARDPLSLAMISLLVSD
jgi:hypothetical protein